MYETVVVPPSFIEKMVEHAYNSEPNECCGILGGSGSVITSVHPIKNQAKSPRKYFADPQELFNAIRCIRKNNEEMIGIYHSHPKCAAEPSEIDRLENEYPGSFYFIISLKEQVPEVRCFVMNEQRQFLSVKIV